MRKKDVTDIRRRLKADEASQRELAAEYHCSQATIWKIYNNKRYREKEEEPGGEND